MDPLAFPHPALTLEDPLPSGDLGLDGKIDYNSA
jgi:hypothetical protein